MNWAARLSDHYSDFRQQRPTRMLTLRWDADFAKLLGLVRRRRTARGFQGRRPLVMTCSKPFPLHHTNTTNIRRKLPNDSRSAAPVTGFVTDLQPAIHAEARRQPAHSCPREVQAWYAAWVWAPE